MTTELDLARQIADGDIPGPATFWNLTLVALPIAQAGVIWSPDREAFVFRDDSWLSERMRQRCVGLPVCVGGSFDGIFGIVAWPFIRDNALYGVARFWDFELANAVANLGTSLSAVFTSDQITRITLSDGQTLLFEGQPSFLKHLAVFTPKGAAWARPRRSDDGAGET